MLPAQAGGVRVGDLLNRIPAVDGEAIHFHIDIIIISTGFNNLNIQDRRSGIVNKGAADTVDLVGRVTGAQIARSQHQT